MRTGCESIPALDAIMLIPSGPTERNFFIPYQPEDGIEAVHETLCFAGKSESIVKSPKEQPSLLCHTIAK
jgi:hypothetical protein